MTEAVWRSLATRKNILVALGIVVLIVGGLWVADPDAFPVVPFTKAEQKGSALPDDDDKTQMTSAERIAQLQSSIDTQQKYLDKLKAQFNDPDSEFKRAEKRFQSVNGEREAARKAIQQLTAAGKTAEAATRTAALKDIDVLWQRRRDRFNLAIKERKTLQESIAAAARQLHEYEQALARRSGAEPASPVVSAPVADNTQADGSAAPAANAKAARTPAASPSPLLTSPFSRAASTSSAAPSSSPGAAAPPAGNVSREVQRAREEVKNKEEAVKKAESKAQSYAERIKILNESIVQTKKLLETARQRADHEQQTKAARVAELRQKTASKAPEKELSYIASRVDAAQRRVQQALDEVRLATDHLHSYQGELNHLQSSQLRATREAESEKQAADAAEEKIAQLQNPFRPRNIMRWLLRHGPHMLLIAIGMFVFYRLSRAFSRRIVQIMAQGASKRGTHKDRENRAQTLVGIFNSALSLVVLGGGSLMMLDAVGIPIVPLMGGAAVVGLAVAFGAQNLIKDYFSGFMVLLEDQYGINDVVKIGDISGLVESISLRTTSLRDLEGTVHFIPHGTIATVSNMTHGWSRALFEIGIDYKEDADRVMKVLLELGRELRKEPAFAALILDDPEMLGIDSLADSSVILKFFIKTRPLQQWTVKREMLRRIKKRFDELGIDIPYPQQTVHYRYDSPPPAGAVEAPPSAHAA